jgi:hypothetical protein
LHCFDGDCCQGLLEVILFINEMQCPYNCWPFFVPVGKYDPCFRSDIDRKPYRYSPTSCEVSLDIFKTERERAFWHFREYLHLPAEGDPLSPAKKATPGINPTRFQGAFLAADAPLQIMTPPETTTARTASCPRPVKLSAAISRSI